MRFGVGENDLASMELREPGITVARQVARLQPYADALRAALMAAASENGFIRVFGKAEPCITIGRSDPDSPRQVELSVVTGDDGTPDACSSLKVTLKATPTSLLLSGNVYITSLGEDPIMVCALGDCTPDEATHSVMDAVAEHILANNTGSPLRPF